MQEAIDYLGDLRHLPLVPFVGPLSRTHNVDIDLIEVAMDILLCGALYRPVHAIPLGFDYQIKKVALWKNLDPFQACDGPRDPGILDGVDLVVAFPDENPARVTKLGKIIVPEKREWWTADPELRPFIRSLTLPVLVVYRDGETRWMRRAT